MRTESISICASFSCAILELSSAFAVDAVISVSITFTSADFLSTSICAACSLTDMASTSVAAWTSLESPPSRRTMSESIFLRSSLSTER